MSPPFTYIVTTQKNDNGFLNRNFLRLTMNARIALDAHANTGPTTVLNTEMYAPVTRLFFFNTVV